MSTVHELPFRTVRHLDAVADADAHGDAVGARQDAAIDAELAMINLFLDACRKLDANAHADFAPKITDWANATLKPITSKPVAPKRYQTVAEAMQEALDYRTGPAMAQMMQLLLNVAFASHKVDTVVQARALLADMALSFASHNTVVEA